MADELLIEGPQDWGALRDDGLTTVVDPLILRAAEVFLAGRSGAAEPAAAWDALAANLEGLAAFFELVVLGDRLPVFDYLVTFPKWEAEAVRGAPPALLEVVNQRGQVLVPVRVGGAAYAAMKAAAVAELRERPPIGRADRAAVLAELAAFDYRWQPRLEGFERAPLADRRLATWLYGGLLFSAYAQELNGVHVLQPKRARIFGTLALGRAADDQGLQALLAGLPAAAPEVVARALEAPDLPSVLPHLLRGSAGPREMLSAALDLRADDDVAAYRTWRAGFLRALAGGRSALEQRRELEAARGALERKVAGPSGSTKAQVSFVGLAIPVVTVQSEVAKEIRPREAWGWAVRRVRGDHRKVLMRLLASRADFERLDIAVREVWDRG